MIAGHTNYADFRIIRLDIIPQQLRGFPFETDSFLLCYTGKCRGFAWGVQRVCPGFSRWLSPHLHFQESEDDNVSTFFTIAETYFSSKVWWRGTKPIVEGNPKKEERASAKLHSYVLEKSCQTWVGREP